MNGQKDEIARVLLKYPDRVPVFIKRTKNKDNIPDIDKHKYLIPREMTVAQVVYIIRKRILLKPEQALFVYVKNTLPPNSSMIETIYHKYKDDDGFLYINYSTENTFG